MGKELVIVYFREGKQYIEISNIKDKDVSIAKFRSRLHPDEKFFIFKEPSNFNSILEQAKDRKEAIETLYTVLREERKKGIFIEIGQLVAE